MTRIDPFPVPTRQALIAAIGMVLLAGLGGCGSTPPAPPSTEVLYAGRADRGTITLRATGYGQRPEDAIRHAEENAFWTLLFRGVPGSPQASAMVRDTPRPEDSPHAAYFDELLAGGRYATFLTESFTEGEPVRTQTGRRAQVTLTVNTQALRRDLEQHGVLRQFGY
ncbi:MAG: hypothetical protein AAFN13_14740 [Bacteroidota bacterium]